MNLAITDPKEMHAVLTKVALFGCSLAGSLALALVLALAGFAPGVSRPSSLGVHAAASVGLEAPPPVEVDTVYVAAAPRPVTITVHKAVQSSNEESEAESEGGDD